MRASSCIAGSCGPRVGCPTSEVSQKPHVPLRSGTVSSRQVGHHAAQTLRQCERGSVTGWWGRALFEEVTAMGASLVMRSPRSKNLAYLQSPLLLCGQF